MANISIDGVVTYVAAATNGCTCVHIRDTYMAGGQLRDEVYVALVHGQADVRISNRITLSGDLIWREVTKDGHKIKECMIDNAIVDIPGPYGHQQSTYREEAYDVSSNSQQERVPQSVQRPVQREVHQPVQRPVQREVHQPVQRPVQREVHQPVQRPVQREAHQPVQHPVQRQVHQQAQNHVQRQVQSNNAPMRGSADNSMAKQSSKPKFRDRPRNEVHQPQVRQRHDVATVPANEPQTQHQSDNAYYEQEASLQSGPTPSEMSTKPQPVANSFVFPDGADSGW